jgi:DNA-directed RNA polymerase subunit RPC12/RpoP
MLFGIALLICAAGASAAKGNVTSAWAGICPYCRSEVFARGASNIQAHGFDCPTCKQRVILRNQRFETVSAIMVSVPTPEIHVEDPRRQKLSYLVTALGILALIIVIVNVFRFWQ